MVVEKPAEYDDSWSGFWLIDERSDSGWSCPEGQLTNHAVVIEIAEKSRIDRVVFDTGGVEGPGKGAKDLLVEVSDQGPKTGFSKIAEVTLADRTDGQSFPVSAKVPGRWVRLTIKNNHGAEDYTQLMDFRAFGVQLSKTPFPNVSGLYSTNYNDFHLLQQGTGLSGCYEFQEGLLSGGSKAG